MPDFLKLVEQAQQMQSRFQAVQEELGKLSVTGSAGGGMVTAETDGKGRVKGIKIDPSVVNATDVASLEDLVLVAIRDSQDRAEVVSKAEIGKLTGGLNLPFKLPF